MFDSNAMPDVNSVRADLLPRRRWWGVYGRAQANRCSWDGKMDFREEESVFFRSRTDGETGQHDRFTDYCQK